MPFDREYEQLLAHYSLAKTMDDSQLNLAQEHRQRMWWSEWPPFTAPYLQSKHIL